LAGVLALAGSTITGIAAGWVREDSYWNAFATFAIVAFPTIFGRAWIWPVAPVDGSLDAVEQVSDSIEHAWELFSM
jgi:hypothetical protein